MLTRPHPPPDETPTLPPHRCPHHSLCFHTPGAYHIYSPEVPSPLLTLLHPHLIFSLAYNLYATAGPSSYASDAALTPPYACLILSAAYHLYAGGVPSLHASEAAYHP
ncbi:hypothetical protein O181_052577 [Austropuccinia psidii MF-1]|uniref:Uncharacterized protein n=1 Tax=Austropuccinia psidii MF-1 TaxID=1389203 RepID=A0A9Q3HQN8_9BASI|nr:hypothetical protein [Austropuccinia psidii MF-1]